jgi:hypothetical protein
MAHLQRLYNVFDFYELPYLGLAWQRAKLSSGAEILHPVVVPDSAIDAVQAKESEGRPSELRRRAAANENQLRHASSRRRRKRMMASDDDIVCIRCYAAFEALLDLDDTDRNSVLMKALGLDDAAFSDAELRGV